MIAYETYSGKAPEDHGPGRRCEGKEADGTRCTWVVSRYTNRQFHGAQGGVGPLLCSRCVRDFDPVAFRKGTLRAKRQGKPAPRVCRDGSALPGLKAARKARGKTQEWLDTAIDAYLGYTGKVERGLYTSSPQRIEQIAEVLGVTVEELKGEQEEAAA